MYRCRCDCGRIYDVEGYNLKNRPEGTCYECGRLKLRKGAFHRMFKIMVRSAEARKLEVSVTPEYLKELYEAQKETCALSGLKLVLQETNADGETTASIDRIDSSKGYVPGNIQWVNKHINIMKSDWSDEEFINFCRAVANHNPLSEPSKNDDTAAVFEQPETQLLAA